MSSSLVNKAIDFTTGPSPQGGETRTLEIWAVMVLHAAGLVSLARAKAIVRAINVNPVATIPGRTVAAGLLAEHIRSLLPENLDDSTLEDLADLARAKADFEAVIEEFLNLQEPVPLPDGQMHDDLDIRDR